MRETRRMSLGFSPMLRVCGIGVFFFSACLLYFLPAEELAQGAIGIFIGIFAVGGAFASMWRRGVVVDERGATLTSWSGLLAPMSRASYPLASLRHVRMTKRIVQTGKGPRILYPVLIARHEADDVELWETMMDYARARRQAETLAKLVPLDFHDETSGETVVREAKYLDEPLAQRYRRLRLPAPLPKPPAGAVARLHPRDIHGETLIEVPRTGMRGRYLAFALFAMFAPLLLIGIFALATFQRDGLSPAFMVVFGGLAAVTLLPGLLVVVHLSTQREQIRISASGIEIDSGSWVRRDRARLPANEIEEIVAPADLRRAAGTHGAFTRTLAHSAGFRSVLIRTDKRTTGVGRWASDAEQLWLRDVLVHALVTSART